MPAATHPNISLSVQQLNYSIKRQTILEDFNLSLYQQKKVALVGLNGAGKSSLLRLLVGELSPLSGKIHYQDMTPPSSNFKQQLGYQAANMQAIAGLTVLDYLQLCANLKQLDRATFKAQLTIIVEQWNLASILNSQMNKLSQGNMQKLAIAQAFINSPQFIILDEPTQALDPFEQQRFIQNLQQLQKFQLCIFSSHHISEAVQIADQVLLLHHGRLIANILLNNIHQYWWLSEISPINLKEKVVGFDFSCDYHNQNNYLYSVKCTDATDWETKIQTLVKLDQKSINLGNGKDALMPLFSLLANERI